MSEFDDIELGPIDYLVVEWTDGKVPDGSALPHLVDLVERGVIRLLDLAFVTVDGDGNFTAMELNDLGDEPEFNVFEGVSSGLISDDELSETAGVVAPGSSAALILYENTWAAPFATALRKNGAQVVANGRIPVNEIMARLDELEA